MCFKRSVPTVAPTFTGARVCSVIVREVRIVWSNTCPGVDLFCDSSRGTGQF